MVGSSVCDGSGVKREQTIAALLPAELLRQRTGRRVELYNEGMAGWGTPRRTSPRRFNEALWLPNLTWFSGY